MVGMLIKSGLGKAASKGSALISKLAEPLPGYKFFVFIYDPKTKIPFVTDFLFEKVSGFGISFDFENSESSLGALDKAIFHPTTNFKSLTLERGRPLVTGQALGKLGKAVSLAAMLEMQANQLKFTKVNILLALCKQWPIPCACWLFYDAVPSEWSMSTLDASSSSYLVETFTIQYSKYEVISL